MFVFFFAFVKGLDTSDRSRSTAVDHLELLDNLGHLDPMSVGNMLRQAVRGITV